MEFVAYLGESIIKSIQLWIHIKHNVGTRPVILTYLAIGIYVCFSWLMSNSGSIFKNSFTSVNVHA
jgi:hypothetical protein